MQFNFDEYKVEVLAVRDQYNDYSVAYDAQVKITDPVKNISWIQVLTHVAGDTESDVKQAFREYLEQGWIRPSKGEHHEHEARMDLLTDPRVTAVQKLVKEIAGHDATVIIKGVKIV